MATTTTASSLYKSQKDKEEYVTEGLETYKVRTDQFGTKYYYNSNGSLHRVGGPALEHVDGQSYWYINGNFHNDQGPAVIQKDASYWYTNGKLHRVGGPAAVFTDGSKHWYQNGLLHRDDGPAIETPEHIIWYTAGVIKKVDKTFKMSSKTPKPRTQKAKSILFGCSQLQEEATYLFPLRGYGGKSLKLSEPILITSLADIKKIPPTFWLNRKVFARPCPKNPKHGFVESRVISNTEELKALRKEVLKEDPDGEIVLTSFLDNAVCNVILTTNGTISIGPGHDGATSGRDSFSFAIKPEELPFAVKKRAGVLKYDNAFIESVFIDQDSWTESFYFTQVRGGPSIAAAKDFIPKQVQVKKVVAPNDDLVAWEKEVKKFTVGTVVYAPGHTLASHAAIHCVINNVPFITSFEPLVGSKLEPSLNAKPSLDQKDFKNGFTLGIDDNLEMHKMLHFSAAVLHNWAYIRSHELASWLLGLSTAYFVKVLCCLSYGEYRYAGHSDVQRETVYRNLLNSPKFASYVRRCPQVARDFRGPLFKSGFGGIKWARATYMCVDIWNLVSHAFNKELNEKTANALVKALNKSVNLVHNNGWLFNKFSDKVLLDFIANHPALALLQLADVVFVNYQKRNKLNRTRQVNRIIYSK